jgi:hypothetical protein
MKRELQETKRTILPFNLYQTIAKYNVQSSEWKKMYVSRNIVILHVYINVSDGRHKIKRMPLIFRCHPQVNFQLCTSIWSLFEITLIIFTHLTPCIHIRVHTLKLITYCNPYTRKALQPHTLCIRKTYNLTCLRGDRRKMFWDFHEKCEFIICFCIKSSAVNSLNSPSG